MGVTNTEKTWRFFGVLHVQALMIWFANLLGSAVKINMSIAVIAMTDTTKEGTFDWSLATQNTILSSLQWGYIISMIPAGELVTRFGGMPLLCFSVGLDSIGCMLMPTAGTYGGWKAVIFVRVIQGIAQGFHYPAFILLISKWVPQDQKARLSALILKGNQIGGVSQLLVSGFIVEALGWQGIFYLDGVLGLIWTVVYLFVGASTPQSCKYISEKERGYIQNSLKQVGEPKKLRTPWKFILTSLPFWLLLISCFGFNWGSTTLMTQVPLYMSKVLETDLITNGILSTIPYAAIFIFIYPFACVSDYLTKNKIFSVTTCRKNFNSIAAFGSAIFLIAMCFAPADPVIFITLLSFGTACSAAFYSGDYGSAGYLAETLWGLEWKFQLQKPERFGQVPGRNQQAFVMSLLVSIGQLTSNIVAFNAPLVSSLLVTDEKTASQWHNVFFLAAGLYISTNALFLLWGTSETQKWNDPAPHADDAENDDKEKVI